MWAWFCGSRRDGRHEPEVGLLGLLFSPLLLPHSTHHNPGQDSEQPQNQWGHILGRLLPPAPRRQLCSNSRFPGCLLPASLLVALFALLPSPPSSVSLFKTLGLSGSSLTCHTQSAFSPRLGCKLEGRMPKRTALLPLLVSPSWNSECSVPLSWSCPHQG